jgi:hypothetical protein
MPNTAELIEPYSLESTPAKPPAAPEFRALTDEEQAEFEDICDFIAERAAILEFEAGYSRADADREAERLAMERFPPSDDARAAILAEADRIAAGFGLRHWKAAERLNEDQFRRLHVNHGYWLGLRDYFERMANGMKRDITG